MVTLYTRGNPVEIIYASGLTYTYDYVSAIQYRTGLLMIIWEDGTVKRIENPADAYAHIVCPGHFIVDVE